MPRFCAVFGCSNRSNRESGKKYFSFPGVRDRRGRDIAEGIKQRECWIKALKRADLTAEKIKNASVCSDHFLTAKPAPPGDTANPDYVPSQKLGYVSSTKVTVAATSRHQRAKKRLLEVSVQQDQESTQICEEESAELSQPEVLVPHIEIPKIMISRHTQTDLATEDILANQELYQLREFKENSTFERSSFVNDDQKTRYYTGIPTYKALNIIFTKLIEPFIKITPQTLIKDKFKHFLIVLMKLRLNLDFTLLSHLFNVSIPTISRLFYVTLRILYFRLCKFILWPSRDKLIKAMPRCFKDAFGNRVTVIVDCFEIRMEKAKNLESRSATWSNYKHHNTAKVLIGITPAGSISFISQAYGGRISDKGLTEDCGILANLNPDDLVLADRGFLIEEMTGLHMAKVMIPSFLKGKKQLDPKDVESTRNLASVRIHVERVIGVLRQKYTILNDIIPIYLAKKKDNDIAVVDQILTVCSALVNLCPPIIEQ